MTIWTKANRAHPRARLLADAHYNRQSVGAEQFVPPSRCLVLLAETATGNACWVTSWPQFAQHAWVGALVNTLFRNEGAGRSSDLIREAVMITRGCWPAIPALGMVTFVDPAKVRRKRDPGRCYLRAGFKPCGTTKGGLLAFQMLPAEMPEPLALLRSA